MGRTPRRSAESARGIAPALCGIRSGFARTAGGAAVSGFFGILRTDGAAVGPRLLEQIAQRLQLRGPDGDQTWAKDGLGTSFAYLETGTRHQSRSQPVLLGD